MRTKGTVLVADDNRDVVTAFAAYLGEDYDVRTAHDGDAAIESLDETVDVVLLDRDMPGTSGDEVLKHVESAGLTCRVAMVSGMEPDFDVVDMGFDDYLVKPIDGEVLRETVEHLHRRATYDAKLQECFALASKQALLKREKDEDELEESEEFSRLKRRLESVRSTLDDTISTLPEKDALQTALTGRSN